MLDWFPNEALGDPFEPEYNDYLVEADGCKIVMYSLSDLFNYELRTEPALWSHCDKCKLDGHKKQYVFPSIVRPVSRNADEVKPVSLIVIGEAPGRGEDESGLGYVGDAGRLLFSMLTQMWKDTMPDLMLGNSVLCWPTDNKTPTAGWYRNCGGKFWPRILCDKTLVADNCLIVVTGAVPYKMIHDAADDNATITSISAAHGIPTELTFSYEDVTRTFNVLPTLHPAAGLHNPDRLPEIIQDFEKVYAYYTKLQNAQPGESIIDGRDENTINLDTDLNAAIYDKMLTPPELDLFMAALNQLYEDYEDKTVSFDVETKSINTADPTNFIIVAGIGAVGSYTFQFKDQAIGSLGEIFKRLRDDGFKVCGHNLWFDLMMCWKERVFESVDDLPEHRDTRVMHKLIDENSTDNKLKFLVGKYFGVPDWSMELNQFTNAAGQLDFSKIPTDTLLKYHRGDLYWNLKLYYKFAEMCQEDEVSAYWVIDYVDFKHRLNKELMQASINGFKINPQVMGGLMKEYESKMSEIRDWFRQPLYQRIVASIEQMDKEMKAAVTTTLCSFPLVDDYNPEKHVFNPNSAHHLAALIAAVLDDSAKLGLIKKLGRKGKTSTGKLSLNADNLEKICEILSNNENVFGRKDQKYVHLVEGMQKVAEFKKLIKIHGTYLEGMVKMTWSDWAVRSQWNVDGAATGRLSSTRPNALKVA